ncbi:MAG: hypothetical protein V4558_15545 [Gemmatimonadota bacterium]
MSRRLALILLALLGMTLLGWSLRQFGAGLSPDSVGYISVARQLVAGHGLRFADGSLLVNQPPLYPLMLAAGGALFDTDPLTVAPALNVLLFGATVGLTGILSFALIDSLPLALVGAAAVAVSVPLTIVTLMAWSEPLFITLLAATLVLTLRWRRAPGTRNLLAWALVVALATLTRYAGLALIGAGMATILLAKQRAVSGRLRDAGLFAIVSGGPLALWMLRNRSIGGTLTGDRAPGEISLADNLQRTLVVFGNWLVPNDQGSASPAVVLLVLAALVLCWNWRRGGNAWLAAAWWRWLPVWLVVLGYGAFLLMTATFTSLDTLDDRLWSPMVVPLVLLVVAAAEMLMQLLRGRWSHRVVPAAVLVSLVLPFHASYQAVADYLADGGSGFGDRGWRESATVAYLRMHPQSCHIYSNEPDAITILTGAAADLSPLRSEHGSTLVTPLPAKWPSEKSACLVWFREESWDVLWSVDSLRERATLEPTQELVDGNVYRVTH